ncbi:ABC transporter ATP-binding protein [Niallia circulans]|uniref:ABC transporter ATP-binding protein n=1 Tax=Niallia circulans TaxID=1397 RepID=A0A553SHQ6_NIACI|nr:ABC transporter ATP-binding protein [Niallia circulans]TRZ36520.1 ABC transporter ATP-binding protein [Niallia circulans]
MLSRLLHLSEKGTKDLKQAIFFCVLSNLVLFVPLMIIMLTMQTIIDPLVTNEPLDTSRLWVLFGFGVISAVVYFLVYGMEYDKTYTAAYAESTNMRMKVAEHMRRLPLSFFNRKDLSELTTNIMGDCTTIEHMVSHAIPQIVANSISITIVSILLAFYDWRMTLALLFVLPISMGIIYLSRKIQERFGKRHVKAKLNVSKQMQEYLDGIKVVKAFGLSGEKSTVLKMALKQMMKESIKFEAIAGSFITLASVILQVGIGIVILVGVNLLTAGSLDVVKFLTFAMISTRIYTPVLVILTMFTEIMYLFTSTKRMKQLRNEPAMEGETAVNLSDCSIEFKNVSFAYNKDSVINNMNITIPQNTVTALVGPSGSGKSTISRLIARFWDVSNGEILVGNKNIRSIDPEALMSYMSFVFQEVMLFNDTVINNIRIGKQEATDEEVFAAAKMARCDGFIEKMRDGYETLIGENGSTLSGGERQRISIARAILKNAPIVLLDEATASIDPENEVLIQEAISELVRNRTVIVIAHKLKTIAGANKIIVLDNGNLSEQGTHEDLLAKKGLYAKLWDIQQESMGWSVNLVESNK